MQMTRTIIDTLGADKGLLQRTIERFGQRVALC